MVKQVQFVDEFYEVDEDDDEFTLFSAPTYYTTDEQLVLIACLMILEQRYRLMKSMTLEQIESELDDIIDSLATELDDVAYNQAYTHVHSYFNGLLNDFDIPYEGYVSVDTSMIEIMRTSIATMINQLQGELKVKVDFFKDNMSKGDFNILPNFKRAVQKLVDAVGSNLIWGKEKSKRNVQTFVYGEDKLYRWITANDDKVCEWCRIQESLPPRTLDEIPLDHPHGRCVLEPVDYDYSDEYYILLARAKYADEIEIFSESKWDYSL